MADIIKYVSFYEDTISVVVDERTGKEYVVPKPMVEMFELDWPSQYRKLTTNQIFARGIVLMTIPSASGLQETILLERRLVHAWLLSINVKKVSKEFQEKLLLYQNECADVLDTYFRQKTSDIDPVEKYPELIAIRELLITTAKARDEAALARQEAHAAETKAIRAEAKAEYALAVQHYLTIREYVFINGLGRQLPPSLQNAYGKWLAHYCLDKGVPVRKIQVADRQYDAENGYHVGTIEATLSNWLLRRNNQTNLKVVKAEDAVTLVADGQEGV